jgi:hypothetical protein
MSSTLGNIRDVVDDEGQININSGPRGFEMQATLHVNSSTVEVSETFISYPIPPYESK